MKAAALNKRDDWISKGMYPGIVTNCTLGSDGCAIDSAGHHVIFCPSIYWGDREDVQSSQFQILGMPTAGTFTQEICISKQLLYLAPNHLNPVEAAAIPLAGLTAWRALMTQGQCQKQNRVLITGIGGGVALFAMQFSIALGCETWVTSSSDDKLNRAKKMGAAGGFRYDRNETLKGRFDVIIDSAGGAGFGALVKALNPSGRLIFYGGTCGKWPEISPQSLFFKQAHIIGSTMGSPKEFSEMLDFSSKHKIKPVIDSQYKLNDAHNAFERLRSPNRFGKVVFSISA